MTLVQERDSVVYSFVVEVEADECMRAVLQVVSLGKLTGQTGQIRDAHLLVATHRLAHSQLRSEPEAPAS